MPKTLSRTFIIVILAIVLVACSDGFPPEFEAPDFTLTAPITGQEITLSDLKGRPLVICWFASW